MIGFLKRLDHEIPLITHPKTFGAKLKIKPSLKYIGPPFRPSKVEASGGVLLLARNPVVIAKGIMTSGEIERNVSLRTSYEKAWRSWSVQDHKIFLL